MKRIALFASPVVALAACLACAGPGLATNGYFTHGFGTKSKGMAGAGVALPQDAMIGATNPAGMAFVGKRLDLGLSLFNPVRQYTVKGAPSGLPATFGLTPGTVKSGRDWFAIPHVAYNNPLGPNSSVGICVYGNGGMNTSYPGSAGGGAGTFYGGPAGVNLEQLFIAPTYASKFGETASWGVAPIFAYQRFEAKGLKNFGAFAADGDADNLSDKGTDTSTGMGFRVGVQGQVQPDLTLAASYQSKMKMSRFKKYDDLFAGRGRFDIPPTATIGLAYKTDPKSVLAFDIQSIWYSKVAAIHNPLSNLFEGPDTTGLLGDDKGAGFGWRDVTVAKLGYQREVCPAWTVRGGVSYGRQPIPSSEVLFNILAPGVEQWHFTGGFTHATGPKDEFTMSVMFAPNVNVKGPNPMEAPGQQTISLRMHEFEAEASWGIKF
ncbi:MAG TPA: outer membrane protein transport protein [Armatimonadota bacterium]|jgi:long-chain fatty acid transport protein